MNRTKEVLALYGLEVGEKFNVAGSYSNPHYFDGSLRLFNSTGETACYAVYRSILNGETGVEKLPFIPKDKDIFYYATHIGNIVSTYFDSSNPRDVALVVSGNCFGSEEEAEKNKEKVLAKIEEVFG